MGESTYRMEMIQIIVALMKNRRTWTDSWSVFGALLEIAEEKLNE